MGALASRVDPLRFSSCFGAASKNSQVQVNYPYRVSLWVFHIVNLIQPCYIAQ